MVGPPLIQEKTEPPPGEGLSLALLREEGGNRLELTDFARHVREEGLECEEYDPRDIPSLVEPVAKNEADVVYGSRFLQPRRSGTSLVHRLGNWLLTSASNVVTGWQLTDMETGFKAFRRELLDQIALEQDGFGVEVELTAKLAALNVRILERPISYVARGWKEGKKIGWRDAVHALYCIVRYR